MSSKVLILLWRSCLSDCNVKNQQQNQRLNQRFFFSFRDFSKYQEEKDVFDQKKQKGYFQQSICSLAPPKFWNLKNRNSNFLYLFVLFFASPNDDNWRQMGRWYGIPNLVMTWWLRWVVVTKLSKCWWRHIFKKWSFTVQWNVTKKKHKTKKQAVFINILLRLFFFFILVFFFLWIFFF